MEITKIPLDLPIKAARDASRFAVIQRELLFALCVLALLCLVLSFVSDSPRELLTRNGPIVGVAYAAALIANATAVGGGVVFLPFFSFFYGLTSLESLKLALSTQAFGMSSGAVHWSVGRIDWRLLAIACACGGIGMTFGTFIFKPDEAYINIAFGATSLLLGVGLLLECLFAKRTNELPVGSVKFTGLLGFAVLCVTTGMVNAWVSIGIGEAVALWFFFRWRFSITQSVAAGVIVLAFCSVLGFVFHAGLGGIPWPLLAFTIPGVILGGRMGAKLGVRLGEKAPSGSSGMLLRVFVAIVIFLDGLTVLCYAP